MTVPEPKLIEVLNRLVDSAMQAFSRVALCAWNRPPLIIDASSEARASPRHSQELLTAEQMWTTSLDMLSKGECAAYKARDGGVIMVLVMPGVALVGQLRHYPLLGVASVALGNASDEIRALLKSEGS